MDCKPTFTDRRRRRTAAMTLVEMLVGSALGLLALTAVLATSMFAGRSFVALRNYVDLDANSRDALDRLSRDIRQMEYLTNYNTMASAYVNAAYLPAGWTKVTNRLTFVPYAGATSNAWLTINYDVTNKTLARISNGVSTVVLTGVQFLNFGLSQRNQANGTFNPITTTNVAEVKLIHVDWVCTRTMLGSGTKTRTNSESIQSAKFVIRRQ
jgi:Tfp pilus assembly protein PilW